MNTLRWLSPVLAASLSVVAFAQGPQSPAIPDQVIDLRTAAGVEQVRGQWHFAPAEIVASENHPAGPDKRPTSDLAPTHDISPRMGTPEFDAAPWQAIAPDSLETRRTPGKLAFAWYRFDFTLPESLDGVKVAGADLIFEIVVDDYAEVWVDGALPQILGQRGGALVGGWNAPSRVVVAHDAKPGQQVHLAIFASNGPLSAPPANYVWIRSATLNLYRDGRGMVNQPTPVDTQIRTLDPRLNDIIEPGTRADRLAQGFEFVEGPVWVPPVSDARYGGGGPGGYLLFSDPNKNIIHRWDPVTGEVSIYRTKSGYSGIGGPAIHEYHQPGSNGLTLDGKGRLTICEHGNRRVTRLEPNGSLTVLCDEYDGKRLNSPNDLVYRSDGVLYFTDPPFGLPKVFDDPRKQLAHSGVYRIVDGKPTLETTDLTGPNGLALSPDEKHLYVDNWDEKRKVVLRFDVAPDGALSNPTTLIDLTSIPGELCFDGMKVDVKGNIYLSAPDGLRIYAPDGQALGVIVLPELAANFAFGDADGKTLYLGARTGLYRLRLKIEGIRPRQ